MFDNRLPQWFFDLVRSYSGDSDGRYAAQLLWQRGIQDPDTLVGFLNPDAYQPTSPFAFGQEMKWALKRLLDARESEEKVTIWGDFDADGVTATSVLWEGLGQFFTQRIQLDYWIPNRLKESHGLNLAGIDRLAASGTRLIITCDTGSTNLAEIARANQLGIDLIITDHHTLPEERPPVVSILNSRYFAEHHPLFHLSGVAVAYKLVEAFYQTLPDVPQQPLESLLDLVAIGLIADLVELSGDCRYLAQKGIRQLQKHSQTADSNRPGVAHLLKLCQKMGDRPTDISFGLGPRINAVSRIYGEASFCVELLTTQDRERARKLAEEAELANTRRKALQQDVTERVKKKLAEIDLSTTNAIVLEDPQWQGGVLGLVAGDIAREYARPTILLSRDRPKETNQSSSVIEDSVPTLARGSARSVNRIDLYQLVASQSSLLHRFGGHPFAAGLSLPLANIALFRDGINQQFHQQNPLSVLGTVEVTADLVVTVAELGKSLFRELKLLEPYGMGNPVPKLLLKNCWFENIKNENIRDLRGQKVKYIKTSFHVRDESCDRGFPGVWWGHYREEIPQNGLCDAIVELDFNAYKKDYEIRLISLQISSSARPSNADFRAIDYFQDLRSQANDRGALDPNLDYSQALVVRDCPASWDDLQKLLRKAFLSAKKLVFAYPDPTLLDPDRIWQHLVGIAKYLSRTKQTVVRAKLEERLNLSETTLKVGIQTLQDFGFEIQKEGDLLQFNDGNKPKTGSQKSLDLFLESIREEQFKRQYFSRISSSDLEEIIKQMVSEITII